MDPSAPQSNGPVDRRMPATAMGPTSPIFFIFLLVTVVLVTATGAFLWHDLTQTGGPIPKPHPPEMTP